MILGQSSPETVKQGTAVTIQRKIIVTEEPPTPPEYARYPRCYSLLSVLN